MPWTMSQGYKDGRRARRLGRPAARRRAPVARGEHRRSATCSPTASSDAHEALFLARHERGVRLVDVRRGCSRSSDRSASTWSRRSRRIWPRAGRTQVIGESFREFERYEAFGVPTFVVGGDATFVRYMTGRRVTRAGRRCKLIQSLVTLIERPSSNLNEFKHTRVPQ